jgi:hypothetical protein
MAFSYHTEERISLKWMKPQADESAYQFIQKLFPVRRQKAVIGRIIAIDTEPQVPVAGAACPMQKIETVDMPRSEALASGQTTLGELSTTVRGDWQINLKVHGAIGFNHRYYALFKIIK